MEGFSNLDIVSSFSYGSVEDGYKQNPTFEHRLRRQYWKTKHTVRQKFKKSEDEYVVASDAEIDVKLEKAEHLQMSCHMLLQALDSCGYHIRALSSNEIGLGDYLISHGENDFTHAGEVMKQVGKVHDQNAKIRLKTVEPITRLRQEFVTFSSSAIGDLSESIKRLEKARGDYRAALLWMKDVSEKLHNPDAREQLTRFREAQATVKRSKSSYEKMKDNLIEKINMVAASRCNLLSCTLPFYQTEMLAYLDQSANKLHKLLSVLRGQTQHQYKLNNLTEEIQELQMDEDRLDTAEVPRKESPGPSTQNGQSSTDNLFGLLQQELVMPFHPPPSSQENTLSSNAIDDDSISKTDTLGLPLVSDSPIKEEIPFSEYPHDLLTEEWDLYSALESQPHLKEEIKGEKTGWSEDLLTGQQGLSDLTQEVKQLLHSKEVPSTATVSDFDRISEDSVFDPLLSTLDHCEESSSSKPFFDQVESFGLDSSLFLPPSACCGQPIPIPLIPVPLQPSTGTETPEALLSAQTVSTLSSTSQKSEANQPRHVSKGKGTDNPSNSKWMNLFAHLDPIANEKA